MFTIDRQKQKAEQWLPGPLGKEDERMESVKRYKSPFCSDEIVLELDSDDNCATLLMH